jgi:hypothetical protein
MNIMTFEEYCETQDWIATVLYDRAQRDELDDYALFEEVLSFAEKNGVKILDADSFDYETYFANWLTDLQ